MDWRDISALLAIGYDADARRRMDAAAALGLAVLDDLDRDGEQALALLDPRGDAPLVVLVYQGSVERSDWWGRTGNLRFWPSSIASLPGRWAAGFARAYEAMRPWSHEMAGEGRGGVVLLGHSRGAAVCQPAFVDLRLAGFHVLDAHAVAAPAACYGGLPADLERAACQKLTCYRLVGPGRFASVRGGDPVCRVPPRALGCRPLGTVHERTVPDRLTPGHRLWAYDATWGGGEHALTLAERAAA